MIFLTTLLLRTRIQYRSADPWLTPRFPEGTASGFTRPLSAAVPPGSRVAEGVRLVEALSVVELHFPLPPTAPRVKERARVVVFVVIRYFDAPLRLLPPRTRVAQDA